MGKKSVWSSFSLLFILASLFVTINKSNSEMFTSLGHLTSLVNTEIEITGYMEKFLTEQLKNLEEAKKILEDFKQTAQVSGEDPENYVGNPVNSFLLIKKLTGDLQRFVDRTNSYDKLKSFIDTIKGNIILPSNEDYEGAIVALHRLEDTYLLSPSDIRKGTLSKNYRSRPLNAFECFELGRIAYEKRDHYHTIRWMSEAVDQYFAEGMNATVDIVDILDYLSFSTAQQGNIKHAVDITSEILTYNPNHERAKANLRFYKKLLQEEAQKLRGDVGSSDVTSLNDPFQFKNPRPESVLGPERDSYEALCRGDFPPISPKRQRKLKCRYVNYHPLLFIAPVKEELVFDNPQIWLYHDVITEKQIHIMKTLAGPKLKRAIVRSPITGQYETADYRISKSGWLRDQEHPKLTYLTELVSAVTNLSMATAEEWQIANYGIGGQYDPHFDFARKSEPHNAFEDSIGNRVATWLFYLEAPEVGGATVFPSVGAYVKPERRSAAFWYNLFPSGDGDYRTRHAACPVLFGTKWVSNKWLHMVGQEFNRPCNLEREHSEELYF